ncbi:hypothetical protein ABT352_33460 [Streptosporangium sp. NPDC000563]|uniref:helix-turn-helix domain-containing protein n=1 Tax=Streptosporangium sp. NPDC000563 TaxID=3154366 RepID=UPI003318BA4F
MSTTTKRGRINRAEVARRYEAGESIRQISDTLPVSHAAVYRALRKAGVTFRPVGGVTGSRSPEERRAAILAAYRDGMHIEEIIATYRTSDDTIKAIAQEAGEPPRRRGQRRRVDWEQVGRLWDEEWPPEAIALLVGCSAQQVRRILREVRPAEDAGDGAGGPAAAE